MAEIEATHTNGYSGRLYGKGEMSIYDKSGQEVFHTAFRSPSIQTKEDLLKQLEDFPTFIKFQQLDK